MFGRKKKIEPARVINTDTGLPKLPEHYYWKVGPKEGLGHSWDQIWAGYGISIHSDFQKKPLYRSSEITSNVAVKVAEEAGRLAGQFYRDRKYAADREKYTGEYPPKKLP